MSPVAQPTLTPEDIADKHEYKHIELVNGQPQEKTMSGESVWVAGQLYVRLHQYAAEHRAGISLGDSQGYQCFPWDDGLVRKPDLSFIKKGRLPVDQFEKGHIRIAPDLMVAVVSPGDSHYVIEQRVGDFLEAGTPLCWVVNPDRRTVTIFRKDGSVDRLTDEGTLTGDDVIPGFTCPVRDLFPPDDLTDLL